MRPASPRSGPGKRAGSGSSPTHSSERLRCSAARSMSTNFIAAILRFAAGAGSVRGCGAQVPRTMAPYAQTLAAPALGAGVPHARLGRELAGDEAGRDRLSAAHVPRDHAVARLAGAGRGAARGEGAAADRARALAI